MGHVSTRAQVRPWLVLCILLLTGCATQTPSYEGNYLDRAVTRAGDDVVATASVLALDEIEEVFGARLDFVGIQPVYLKITNLGAHSYLLFLKSVDPDYFSPYEVARRAATLSLDKTTGDLYPGLRDAEIQRLIPPGATVSGFVFTHLDEGLKAFNLELLSDRQHQVFHMAVDVPGLTTDYADFDSAHLQDGRDWDLDLEALRLWLRGLPCCTASAEGVQGDPLNLVLVGDIMDIRAALVGADWDVTAEVDSASLRRLVTAFLFGSRFRYAPVSPLYLFGRPQDTSFQKARAVIDERNHIRLWLAPVTHDGAPVWVGHVSRDAGIKLSGRLWPPTTHVIDPAVDEARFFVLQDLLKSNAVERLAVVKAMRPVPEESPRVNAEGDPYFTDGLRIVLFIGDQVRPMSEIEVADWAELPLIEPFRRDGLFSTHVEG